MLSMRVICRLSESGSNIAYSLQNVKLTIQNISRIIAAMLNKILLAKHHQGDLGHHVCGVDR